MRGNWFKLSVLFTVIFAVVGVVIACGPYGRTADPMQIPGTISTGQVHGNSLWAITSDGKLAVIDLEKQKVTELERRLNNIHTQ